MNNNGVPSVRSSLNKSYAPYLSNVSTCFLSVQCLVLESKEFLNILAYLIPQIPRHIPHFFPVTLRAQVPASLKTPGTYIVRMCCEIATCSKWRKYPHQSTNKTQIKTKRKSKQNANQNKTQIKTKRKSKQKYKTIMAVPVYFHILSLANPVTPSLCL
jgi:hypothetical protein